MLVTLTLNLVYVIEIGASRLLLSRKPQCSVCGGELQFLGFETTRPQAAGLLEQSLSVSCLTNYAPLILYHTITAAHSSR
jgi:hypothetical protein